MRFWVTLLALCPVPAAATPTYLACTLTGSDGKPFHTNIASDEANQTVTYSVPSTGYSERFPALFSAATVSWTDKERFTSLRYELSRTDLTFTRQLTIGDQPSPVKTGTCKLESAPKRAF